MTIRVAWPLVAAIIALVALAFWLGARQTRSTVDLKPDPARQKALDFAHPEGTGAGVSAPFELRGGTYTFYTTAAKTCWAHMSMAPEGVDAELRGDQLHVAGGPDQQHGELTLKPGRYAVNVATGPSCPWAVNIMAN